MAREQRKRFSFTVEGNGIFPTDMLRYDACWPRSEFHDSASVLGFFDASQRRVVLETDTVRAPTAGRWESFGWRVIGVGELRDPIERPTPIQYQHKRG